MKSTYQDRKQARIDHYHRFVHGWKQRDCSACAGSGYYDSIAHPPCGACEGMGKELYKPEENSDAEN